MGTVCSCAGGLNAAPESFFPTLPSLSLLVEDAAEGFSSLFTRSTPDMQGADDADDAKSGTVAPCPFLVIPKPGVCLSTCFRSLSRRAPHLRGGVPLMRKEASHVQLLRIPILPWHAVEAAVPRHAKPCCLPSCLPFVLLRTLGG